MGVNHKNRHRMPRGMGRGHGGRGFGGGRRGGGSFMRNRFMIRAVIALIIGIFAWFGKGKLPNDQSHSEKQGDFTVHLNCSWVDHHYNDGDSFFVQHQGEQVQYRLYYVDCPETKDKPYNNHQKRIADQGRALGGLSKKETIKRGLEAKKFTARLLKKGNFNVYTKNERVYDSDRFYAFISVDYDGEKQWLHEVLVKKGLARVHTKGIKTPEGESYKQHKAALLRQSPTQ